MTNESFLSKIVAAPPIEMFVLMNHYNNNKSDKKSNLSIGVYRTEEGNSFQFPIVKQVEKEIVYDPAQTFDYLPALGLESFFNVATKLLLGEDSVHIKSGRAFGLQALSGTGGLRLGAEFLARIMGRNVYYYSDPSWDNHSNVFREAGFTDERTYRYWNPSTHGLDFDGMIEDLQNAPEGAIIVLQVCGHNPTGIDPTQEQWRKIADVIEERKLFPFFDAAYHGFASGDLDTDVFAVRHFADRNLEFFCSQSFAKNFGIYNVRCGALTIVTNDAKKTSAIYSQMALRVFFIYESPPALGVRLVGRILNDPEMQKTWRDTLKMMASRIVRMRKLFQNELIKLNTPGSFDYITQQKGMFVYTGFSKAQVDFMREKYHIYMMSIGRLNVCGVNDKNVEYVAKAFDHAVRLGPNC